MIEFTLPGPHALAVMLLIGAALVLFSREKIPLETTCLVVLVALTVGFQLFPFEADDRTLSPSSFFLAFGNRALIAVCALMIIGHGLIRTGALEPVGRMLTKLWRRWPGVSLLFTLLITAFLSAFINNTPIVVLMLPLLVGVARRTGRSPSGALLPMGFASILGGMTTTIGTSTNLLVVNVAADMGMNRFGMFDFLALAIIPVSAAIVYLWLIAPRLLPAHQLPTGDTSARLYTAQVKLDDNSVATGGKLAEAISRTGDQMSVESVHRGNNIFIAPLPDVLLRSGDRLTTLDTQENLREFARALGGTLYSGEHAVDDEHPLTAEGQQIAEVAITPASVLKGIRISSARLRSKYGLRLLAFTRLDETHKRKWPGLADTTLRTGDVLLVQSTRENLAELKSTTDFLILDGEVNLPRTSKAPLALATLVAVVVLAATHIMPIEISAALGCLVLITTGCLTWQEAMSALNTKVVLIIVASLSMGAALMQTGGADWLAQVFVSITFGASPAVVLASLMLMMGLLTNLVSNNAAAVIGTPIAIGIAQQLGLQPEPFVLSVLFGANLSFCTPMAYQTNVLIMNAGGYKFADFVRVGVPLALIVWLLLTGILVSVYDL